MLKQNNNILHFLLWAIAISIFFTTNTIAQQYSVLDSLLKNSKSAAIQKVCKQKKKYKVQICYSSTLTNNKLITYGDTNAYFYPASLVKLPIALFALEKINELQKTYPITISTPFKVGNDFLCSENPTYLDTLPTTTIEECIKKIFLVSDNNAHNMLFEFVGQEYINKRLKELAFKDAQIIKRLSSCDTNECRFTGPIVFFNTENQALTILPQECSTINYYSNNAYIGKAYYKNGELVKKSMDFNYSNKIKLTDLHRLLVYLNDTTFNQLHLTSLQKQFLIQSMSALPRYSDISIYNDTIKYPDTYCKYFLRNSFKTIDSTFTIANKVGMAYGFLADCAYISHTNNNSFYLSTVIYCNEDEVLNDGKYSYEKIGFPFLNELYKLIDNFELQKNKQNTKQ